ncbi:HlyD family secretion protein [Stappia indica]|uniref:HlyD family secretion protein n=1 Tax=Stappia indica TaxID=538381 RepID=UPI000834E61D|nr:HlyD family efflux transporter periplasmic adaptor subunit [Stappia indica]
MKWKQVIAVAAVIVAVAGGVYLWRTMNTETLPEGIASSNGRIEAERVDVATKMAGRVAEVLVGEGEMAEVGQLVARMDVSELNARIAQARATVAQAEQGLRQSEAQVALNEAKRDLAEKEHQRTVALVERQVSSQELADQRRTALDTAVAGVDAAKAGVELAKATIESAKAAVAQLEAILDDTQLRAPRGGRVQYLLAREGEVLGAGGKVLTLTDLTDIYMTIFLPARDAGLLQLGSEARLILDPIPDYVIPASVTFVASNAQFTPKSVETPDERENLMFRVKLSIPKDLLVKYQDRAKAGVAGVGYVRTDPAVAWPGFLEVKLPQ